MKVKFKRKVKNKKGNVLDLLFIGIAIFIFAIVIVFNYMIMSKINDGIQATGHFTNASIEIIDHQVEVYPSIWDKGLAFILFAFCMTTWISAFFVRSHPIFVIIGIIMIVIYIMIFGMLANVYDDIKSSPELNTYFLPFVTINFIMFKFPIIMAVLSGITCIIMYSKGGEPTLG